MEPERDDEDIRLALDRLDAELDRQYDDDEMFGDLDGVGYKRVTRAQDGIVSIRQYLDWRAERE